MLTCLTLPWARKKSLLGVWTFCSLSLSNTFINLQICACTHSHTHTLTVRLRSFWHQLSKQDNCLSFLYVCCPCGALPVEIEAKMAVDTGRQQTHCSDLDSRSLMPLKHTINIPHTGVVRRIRGCMCVEVGVGGFSISSLNCENHKEHVIKQKRLGAHAERQVLNRGVGHC